jgi:hypothetical protein
MVLGELVDRYWVVMDRVVEAKMDVGQIQGHQVGREKDVGKKAEQPCFLFNWQAMNLHIKRC